MGKYSRDKVIRHAFTSQSARWASLFVLAVAASAVPACAPGESGDIAHNAQRVLLGIQMSSDATNANYEIPYETTPSWVRLYIDTDRDAASGYSFAGIGADYLIENGDLYRYAGAGGTAWGWTFIKTLSQYDVSGGVANVTVARADLGSPATLDLIVQLDPGQIQSGKLTQTFDGSGTTAPMPTPTPTPTPTPSTPPSSEPAPSTPPPASGSASNGLIGPRPVAATDLSRGTLFASPSGDGTTCSAAAPCSAATVVGRAGAGDVVFFRGGTYSLDSDLDFAVSGTSTSPIIFESYPGEQAVFDGSSLAPLSSQVHVNVSGSWLVLRRFEVRKMPERGMIVDGSHVVLEGFNIHHNYLWGLLVPGSYNEVRDTMSHDNSDVGIAGGYDGDNSDGITVLGTSILVSHCLSYGNSDDGFDSWESIDARVEYSISHSNGLGGKGNGMGFKMGGPPPSTGAVVDHSIAYNNRAIGFTWNQGGPVAARNVTSFGNKEWGFYIESNSTIENCIESNNALMLSPSVGTQTNNSWQRGGQVQFENTTDPSAPNFLRPIVGGGFEDIGAYAGL